MSSTSNSKVFVVEATVALTVQGRDEDEALALAKTSLEGIQSAAVTDLDVFALRRLSDVPATLRDTIPGNMATSETVSDYLEVKHVEFCEDPMCSSCNKLLERRY